MITLSVRGTPHGITTPIIGRITTDRARPADENSILAVRAWEAPVSPCAAILCSTPVSASDLVSTTAPVVHSVAWDHLTDGDVVRLDSQGYVRTLYRRDSRHNTLFATERCNSLCLMCSQPPRDVDDEWRIAEMLDVIRLMDPATPEIGITGGEPTLLKDGFLRVVQSCKDALPNTSLHVLSNGRLFRYGSFARRLAEIQHPDLMIGIPVYSAIDSEHDHVVQAVGAFDDTVIGLQNLGRYGVPVEIRVVVHRLTYAGLLELAEFIYRNMTYASHVALMGLEMMGFAVPNIDQLWIDPWNYRKELEAATLFLAERGMHVSVYNHQLCTVPESIWPYCRQSISDWKNEYVASCDQCGVRTQCGGFFSSGVRRRYSEHIAPVPVQLETS